MRESIFRGFFVSVLAAMTVSWCAAGEETVETVLARAENAYAASNGISSQVYQRQVWVPLREMPGGAPSRFGPSTSYRVLTLRKRKPDDWYVASWSFTVSMNRPMGPVGPAVPAPVPRASGYVLSKSGAAGVGKMSSFGRSNQPVVQNSLTDDEFSQTLRSRLLDAQAGFPAFSPLLDAPAGGGETAHFGLQNPRLAGEETWNNHASYRVDGSNVAGGQTIVWIDKESGLIVRMLAQQGRATGMFSVMFETIYTTTLGVKLSAADFIHQPPSDEILASSVQLTEGQMGFGSVADLAQYAGGLGEGQAGGNRSSTPSVAAPAVPEQQALSTEQMEGIIFIEGDEGTATGFMTQIKGVDFVVTNQHVLGENKKITLKNLHGEVVPVLQIFGAVGSDIAIMRIAKGQGTLKIAEDVLKSVKIGDKIVVVGNRLGGGVATQTSGQVLGVGPTRIEVNANFEPGNSGSPIFSTGNNEVVGVATYAETRKIAVEESSGYNGRSSGTSGKVEKRWFGYRLDSITKWEAINMERWHAQSARIEEFRDMSEALVAVIRLKLNTAAENKRLAPLIADLDAHIEQRRGNRAAIADDMKSFFYTVRSLAESGIRDFEAGDYYDYYRTCLYWENSITMQVDYRKAIVEVLKKYEANSTAYVSRMRSGGGN